MGQFCDSVNGESHSMPVEERNELNTQALQDIYGSIDLLTEAVNSSDNGSYLHDRVKETLGLLYAVHWPYYQYKT